jgi:hypothetical protein
MQEWQLVTDTHMTPGGMMKPGPVLLIVVVVLLGFAYFRGKWPFSGRAIADCAASGDIAFCLQTKYGWSQSDALIESADYRVHH